LLNLLLAEAVLTHVGITPLPAGAENCLCFGHCAHFAEGDVAGQMIEAARARNDRLVRCQPSVCGNALGNQCAGLDIRGLDVYRTDTKLFISEQTLEIVRPIMLY